MSESVVLRNSNCKLQIYVTYDFLQCTVLTDLLTRFCGKLIYVYVIQLCISEIIDFFKFIISSYKFMQLAIFWQINLCARF